MPEQSVPIVSIRCDVVRRVIEDKVCSEAEEVFGCNESFRAEECCCLPGVLPGVALGIESIKDFAVKQRVGPLAVLAWRQPHLEHLGVFVYVGKKGDSGSLIEKNVWVLMFLSDIISQNLNNECCSSGLGWVSKNCLYASSKASATAD